MVVWIGKDCWDIILNYKKQIEFYEDLRNNLINNSTYTSEIMKFHFLKRIDEIMNEFDTLYYKAYNKSIVNQKDIIIEDIYIHFYKVIINFRFKINKYDTVFCVRVED